MSSMLTLAGNAAPTGFYDFPIEQSLRFEAGDTAYLSQNMSASNRKTFTISVWVKRSELDGDIIMGRRVDGNNQWAFQFTSSGQLDFYNQTSGSVTVRMITNAVFRDVSAWYNIVLKVDVTTGTSANAIYVNGVEQSLSTDTSSNSDTYVNSAGTHYIGAFQAAGSYDGYMADFNFIDGQALDATSFGETKSGIWIPKDTAGLTFGTNGFRLQFGNTTDANGFNTVTYTGNGGTLAVKGVGFEPDMVWLKSRSAAYDHVITDSVRGVEKQIIPNKSDAESQQSGKGLTSFDSDGFTLTIGSSTSYNNSGQTYVGWAWDAGSGSAASNTDGSITSTVKANTDYGFSVVKWTGTATAGTVGHGLSSAPEMIIVKNVSVGDQNWQVFHASVGNTFSGQLQSTTAFLDRTYWNDTDPTSSVFSISGQDAVNESGNTIIAYAFHSVTGYSKFGSYVGNGSSSGPSITGLGFKPAFLLIKSSTAAEGWQILDNTREVTPDEKQDILYPNLSNAEATISGNVEFTDDGFNVNTNIGNFNLSGQTYIYMAFADTRNAAFWKDTSSQGNDWQPNNLVFSDVVPDSTTNNWCVIRTMNDPEESGVARAEGNLKYTTGSGTSARNTNKIGISNILPSTGKWYAEVRIHNTVTSFVGVGTLQGLLSPTSNNTRYAYLYSTDGNSYVRTTASESISTHGGAVSVGDVVGIYVDMDAATPELYFSKNGQWSNGSGSFNQSTPTSAITLGDTFFTADTSNENQLAFHCCSAAGGTSAQFIWNFGQDSTFAGNENAGGNTDANGIGDFFSTVPDDALALCTANLPSGAIDTVADETPEDYFNTVTFTGTGSSNSVTGVGFEPSLSWFKNRSAAYSHQLVDQVRGKIGSDSSFARLASNLTNAEATPSGDDGLTSFDSDGFTVLGDESYNSSGQSMVAWNWKANGSGVSNTDGSITSTVSVGATSQQNWFSVASFTGTGANATVGHGLGVTPDMIIVKGRDNTDQWFVYHTGTSSSPENDYIYLNLTSAKITGGANPWNGTAHTSSVFNLGSDGGVNGSSLDYIAYCFANADGLCKVGSYTGNGSSDGTFIYTGFRPAFILTKVTSTTNHWGLWDNKRLGRNPTEHYLIPNLNNAEGNASSTGVDFLSNGFKFRGGSAIGNQSGQSFIYLAIAEQPFKFANAR